MSELKAGAIHVAKRLIEAGHEAYFAGGCVRDYLLNKHPKDWDIATSARPEQVQALFRRTLAVGAAFGVIEVIQGKGRSYEVSTYRADGAYSDGRRPDDVQYSKSRVEDVKRRDFTINALLMHPETLAIEDYVDGQADLANGILRAVGKAEQRFQEDRLRMLRAVRFAARFGFSIEENTWGAIVSEAEHLKVVSPERISQELEKIMLGPNPVLGLQSLLDANMSAALPKIVPDDWVEVWKRFAGIDRSHWPPQDSLTLAWSLYHCGLEKLALEKAVRERRLSKNTLRGVLGLRDDLKTFSKEAREGMRLAIADRKDAFLVRAMLLAIDEDALHRFDEASLRLQSSPPKKEAMLTGADLMSVGLKPGPMFKEILQQTTEAVYVGLLKTKGDALQFAQQSAERLGTPPSDRLG